MRLKLAMAASAMVVSVVMMGTSRAAAEDIKSGLAVGERVNPFDVEDITGPNKGKTLCYR
jgi:hypothetical protein